MVVEGQIVGGVVHGVGNAFFERMLYSDDAQPVSTNFGEYLLPLATDSPNVEVLHMETPSPLNPLGLKAQGRAARSRPSPRWFRRWRMRWSLSACASPKRRSRRRGLWRCWAKRRGGPSQPKVSDHAEMTAD
jgi:hypothetical protein